MKRAGILGLAIVLTIALGVGMTQAKKHKVKVDTAVSFSDDYDYDDATGTVTVFGEVRSPKPKCRRHRTVHLRQVDQGLDAGSGVTDQQGNWEASFSGIGPIDEGFFQATAEKRRIEKKHKITVQAGRFVQDLPRRGLAFAQAIELPEDLDRIAA